MNRLWQHLQVSNSNNKAWKVSKQISGPGSGSFGGFSLWGWEQLQVMSEDDPLNHCLVTYPFLACLLNYYYWQNLFCRESFENFWLGNRRAGPVGWTVMTRYFQVMSEDRVHAQAPLKKKEKKPVLDNQRTNTDMLHSTHIYVHTH